MVDVVPARYPRCKKFLDTARGCSDSLGRVHRRYTNYYCETQENSSWLPEFYFSNWIIVVFSYVFKLISLINSACVSLQHLIVSDLECFSFDSLRFLSFFLPIISKHIFLDTLYFFICFHIGRRMFLLQSLFFIRTIL